ncbi:hypothetical protein M378DRAFT_70128 [Amanita muscaria Koide BX008]|uniref:Pericentrin/AKAP-450 centrosomal targeting domain-containing protein n=1 Tax=Amanita muscaria (strain Koide BX008) TaxID=946122 RepID=A0A0C2XI71_AMAMK|nr:hypothetical protein M378DRAFT_70128 [Amanita muscaria Koide BX008]
MAAMLETPSRIWRRIEAIENRDMPSLPSLPPFEDSDDGVRLEESSDILSQSDGGLNDMATAVHSTPAATSHGALTFRAASSTSSTARFARSIASRSTRSSTDPASVVADRRKSSDSFDVSRIVSLPKIHIDTSHRSNETDSDMEDVHAGMLLPPQEDQYEDDDLSISDALRSISRSSSPAYAYEKEKTPMKPYDYSVSLKSEPKPSPINKFRNVALRRPLPRNRTPSLTHTLTSTSSSSTNDTPPSPNAIAISQSETSLPIPGALVPLPPSRAASESPAVAIHRPREDISMAEDEQRSMSQSMQMQSMDITDVQISPPQLVYSDHQDNEDTEQTEQNEATSDEPPEPTFSSEAEETARGQYGRYTRSPATASVAQSSPAQPVPFTPTPAFPRPRARFNLPETDDLATPRPPPNQYQQPDEDETDLMTPHSRRRSFLLSVINSTTKPRLAHPTPHPRQAMPFATPGISAAPTPVTALRTAFAGVTPRPRFQSGNNNSSGGTFVSRFSSATTQSPPNAETSDTGVSNRGTARVQARTPGQIESTSPQLPTENASFISTASSHDLTTHQRVNTSFDPSMGFGTGGPGNAVGRFNAGKLNNYLHSLNRRLQEENEILLEKLRKLQEEKEGLANEKHKENLSAAFSSESRRSSIGRRISGGTVLDDVREDVIAEDWQEEKAELEDLIESYKEGMAQITEEKDQLQHRLGAEREERDRDKQRWKDRITELEEGVEVIVKDLEQKLEQSEETARQVEEDRDRQVRDLTRQLSLAEDDQAMALERAERAERALESEQELGGELRETNERLSKVMSELRNADSHIQDLEQDLARAGAKVETLEKTLRAEKDNSKGLVEELDKKVRELARERERVQGLEAEVRQVEEHTKPMETYIADLEEQMENAADRIASLEGELTGADQELQKALSAETEARQRFQRLELDLQKAQELEEQMEDALEDAERKRIREQDIEADLRAKVDSLERELERERERRVDPSRELAGHTEAEIQTLEDELDAANRDIARLNTILNQSPARKAVDKAKDMRIEVLEREKEELLERNKALRTAMNEMNTPSKIVNASGISPIHRHVLSLSIRAPRTPGGPLKDLSWLNSTQDPSVSPLVAEITRLNRELDRANESIDDKLDKLEDAGLGVVALTKKLEDARSKISALEDEISRQSRREDRLIHRMERIRCQKCRVKVDLRSTTNGDESLFETFKDNLPDEPETPPTRTSEALRTELRSVNSQLENLKKQWEDERRQLVGENVALQDAADRLNAKIRNAQEEARRAYESGRVGEKAKASVEGELEKARRVIEDLEEKLRGERKNLRSLMAQQDRLQREKAEVLSQLQRTESDMDDVRQQMHKVKQENHDLEKELRVNATAEQKARILESRVTENLETIDQLRNERSLLAVDYKQLQRRYTELTEQANQLRSKYSVSSSSHEKRRHQLDLYCVEIEDLRSALNEQANELHRAEKEKDRVTAEKEGVVKIVSSLEADLRRVKKDAEAFGRDLKRLRAEKENMEESHKREISRLQKAKKQAHTQMRLLTDQLENYKDAASRAREELKRHNCAADDSQIAALKLQHNKECKGLIVQIKYLKAKFTRESGLRMNLCYQKEFLLVLLKRYEKSEETIFASIARIGFPVSSPPKHRKPPKLRSVVVAVLFSLRAE